VPTVRKLWIDRNITTLKIQGTLTFRVKALGREVSSQTLSLTNLCKFMYYLKHEWSVLSRDGFTGGG
jgi:hypothetical protein